MPRSAVAVFLGLALAQLHRASEVPGDEDTCASEECMDDATSEAARQSLLQMGVGMHREEEEDSVLVEAGNSSNTSTGNLSEVHGRNLTFEPNVSVEHGDNFSFDPNASIGNGSPFSTPGNFSFDPVGGPSHYAGRSLRLKHLNTGLCLDYDFRHSDNVVVLWDCHDGDNQRWRWDNNRLKSNHDDNCLDYAVHDAGNAVVWECNGGRNQLWSQHREMLRNGYSGKCLTPVMENFQGSRQDAQLELQDCNGRSWQKWRWAWY